MPIVGSIIVPTVGCGREREVQKTIDAYRAAAQRVCSWEPRAASVPGKSTPWSASRWYGTHDL